MTERTLEDLKKNYESLKEKYDLPSFEEMNSFFTIEKLFEVQTESLLREIRRFCGERISSGMRIVESMLNPSNVQMFVYAICKSLTSKEKETLNEIYKKMTRFQLKALDIDLSFDEKEEAQFIKEIYQLWEEFSAEMKKILSNVKCSWDKEETKEGKGYFN